MCVCVRAHVISVCVCLNPRVFSCNSWLADMMPRLAKLLARFHSWSSWSLPWRQMQDISESINHKRLLSCLHSQTSVIDHKRQERTEFLRLLWAAHSCSTYLIGIYKYRSIYIYIYTFFEPGLWWWTSASWKSVAGDTWVLEEEAERLSWALCLAQKPAMWTTDPFNQLWDSFRTGT